MVLYTKKRDKIMFQELDKAIVCLAAELPESVYDDVTEKYTNAKNKIKKVTEILENLVKAIDEHNEDPKFIHSDWVEDSPELTSAREILEKLK